MINSSDINRQFGFCGNPSRQIWRDRVEIAATTADSVTLGGRSKSEASILKAVDVQKVRALAPKPADSTDSDVSGFIGDKSVFATIHDNGGRVDMDGSVGMVGIDLHEDVSGPGFISGMLTAPGGGMMNVDIQVQGGPDTNRFYSGMMGNAMVNLTETPQKDGSWITGSIGNRSYSVTRRVTDKNTTFDGTVGSQFINVTLESDGKKNTARHDPLVPLFALA